MTKPLFLCLVVVVLTSSLCRSDSGMGAAGFVLAAGAQARADEADRKAQAANSRADKAETRLRNVDGLMQELVQVLGKHGYVYIPPEQPAPLTFKEERKRRGY